MDLFLGFQLIPLSKSFLYQYITIFVCCRFTVSLKLEFESLLSLLTKIKCKIMSDWNKRRNRFQLWKYLKYFENKLIKQCLCVYRSCLKILYTVYTLLSRKISVKFMSKIAWSYYIHLFYTYFCVVNVEILVWFTSAPLTEYSKGWNK